ncbi:MAG TPA: alpha/beta hydrolase [Ferruginibacter sp.]|nr:alpha/beta hydrolase [Ferruginibacter sp.]
MPQLLLLHGAIGSKDQLKDLENILSSSYKVHSINFKGHGGSAFTADPFSIRSFAEEVITFLRSSNIDQINIFGYSMGGYVAMYLAKHYPGKINKVITLATKFSWNRAIAEKEIKMLNAEKIEGKIPSFAAALKERHLPQNWKLVLEKTIDLLTAMGENNPLQAEDYLTIHQPVLLMLGDRDKMVTLEETLAVYKGLPNAQLSIIPNTSHPVEVANTARLAFEISSFLDPANPVPATYLPQA